MAFTTFVDVLAAFGVTYSSPYMLKVMGNKVGYVLGALSCIALVFVIFFRPELSNRSLEELNEMFDAKIWAWQFATFETHGAARELAALEHAGSTQRAKDVLLEMEGAGTVKVGIGFKNKIIDADPM